MMRVQLFGAAVIAAMGVACSGRSTTSSSTVPAPSAAVARAAAPPPVACQVNDAKTATVAFVPPIAGM